MKQAIFISGYRNCRLLRNQLDITNEKPVRYVIERSIMLKHEKFIHFREHLLDNNINIEDSKNDIFIDEKGVWHVMMFFSINSDIMLLVYNDSTNYAKYVSIISNGGERIEKNFTTKDRYKKIELLKVILFYGSRFIKVFEIKFNISVPGCILTKLYCLLKTAGIMEFVNISLSKSCKNFKYLYKSL